MKELAIMSPWLYAEPDDSKRYTWPPPEGIATALEVQFDGRRMARGRSDPAGEVRIAIDAADGRNVFVHIQAEELRMFGRSEEDLYKAEEEEEDDDDPDMPLLLCIEQLVPFLYDLTGWYAESELVLYDTDGVCSTCERSYYDWEDSCRQCGSSLR